MAGAKRAVIVGAASGIGAAGARRLAADGWRLALIDIAEESLQGVAGEVGAVCALGADAADPEALAVAVDEAVERLGGLEAAWSNAGVQLGGEVEQLDLADLDLSYAVNLRAHVVVARRTLAALRETEGSILLTASNSGLQTEPALVPYAVTKAAAVALMRCLARDLAPARVRVNALCPGYVDTPFNAPLWAQHGGRAGFLAEIDEVIPMGFMATPEQIAGQVAFLLSEAASYITGHALVADGGELVS